MRILFLCFLFVAVVTNADAQQTKISIQLNHTAIYVKDLQKAAFFYEHVMGYNSGALSYRQT